MQSREARDECRTKRHKRTDMELQKYISTFTPEEARLTKRSGETGVWLTAIPHTFNGNVLSKEEFRDSLRLWFGLGIDGLPSKCYCCGADFDFAKSLNRNKGDWCTEYMNMSMTTFGTSAAKPTSFLLWHVTHSSNQT